MFTWSAFRLTSAIHEELLISWLKTLDVKEWWNVTSDSILKLFDRQWRWILLCQIIGDRLTVVYSSMFFCFFFFETFTPSQCIKRWSQQSIFFFRFYLQMLKMLMQLQLRRSYWLHFRTLVLYFCSSHQLHSKFCNILDHLVVRFDLYGS